MYSNYILHESVYIIQYTYLYIINVICEIHDVCFYEYYILKLSKKKKTKI